MSIEGKKNTAHLNHVIMPAEFIIDHLSSFVKGSIKRSHGIRVPPTSQQTAQAQSTLDRVDHDPSLKLSHRCGLG